MESRAEDGWVRVGDQAPSFELPDSGFKAVRAIGSTRKVTTSLSLRFVDSACFEFIVHLQYEWFARVCRIYYRHSVAEVFSAVQQVRACACFCL